jgi:hypothetical protein
MTEMRSALKAGLSMTGSDSERIAYILQQMFWQHLMIYLHDDLSMPEFFITMFYMRFNLHPQRIALCQ